MPREPFTDRLRRSVLVGDGAMGTRLFANGVTSGVCVDALNLTRSDLVEKIHAEYVTAGSDLIETNTFGANRIRLAQYNLADSVVEINRAGVDIARLAAGDDVYVAGAVGPLGRVPGSADPLSRDEHAAAFEEQIAALAGADLLILETFTDLDEALLALEVAKRVASLPVVCQINFTDLDKTAGGIDVVSAGRSLTDAGADVVGANCGKGPAWTLTTARKMVRAGDWLVSAFPNAGFPEFIDGRTVYQAHPQHFSDHLLKMIEAGVNLVGGCCGTTPEDIAEIVTRLGDRKPAERRVKAQLRAPKIPAEVPKTPAPDESEPHGFLADLKEGKRIIVELDPPKGIDVGPRIEAAKALADAGVDAITVAENPLAVLRLGNFEFAYLIQRETNVKTIVHVTGRDRNSLGLQSVLMGAHAMGIENILALTGDPASGGDVAGASSVYDMVSLGIIHMLGQLNRGVTQSGNEIGGRTRFNIGCGFNPNVLGAQVKKLQRKIGLGAQYVLTQPLYDAELVRKMTERTKDLGVPVVLGVMPVVSERNAEFIHNEFPGIVIPESVRKRMKGLSGKKGRAEGTRVVAEMIEEVFDEVDGIYIIPPFDNHRHALRLMETISKLRKE